MQLGIRPAITSAWVGGEQVGYQLPGRWLVPAVFAVLGLMAGLGQWSGAVEDWRLAVAVTVTLIRWVLIGWLLIFLLASWVFALAIAFGVLKRAWEPIARWNARARAARAADERAPQEATAQQLRRRV